MSSNDFSDGDAFVGAERVGLIILGIIPPLIMIPLNIFILHIYSKYNKTKIGGLPMFKTTVVFIIITVMFYICYCLRAINFCYGDMEYERVILAVSVPLYGGHFLFFIVLLFQRLRKIFEDSQYELNKCTANVFYFLVAFGLVDAVLFILLRSILDIDGIWWRLFHAIGLLAIFATYVWISILYIIKLFNVVQDTVKNSYQIEQSSSSAISASTISSTQNVSSRRTNERFLTPITKYTLLTTISLLINLIYTGITQRPKHNYYHYTPICLALLFWQLSISVNIIGFALGFHFSQSLYTKICARPDKSCKLCFQFMVYFTLQKKENKEQKKEIKAGKTIVLEIQQTNNKT
eukprot:10896_1